jgi:hypothetical protein
LAARSIGVMMHRKDIPTFTGDAWLASLLEYAAISNACVSWGCTTCGARLFRDALVRSARSPGRLDSLYEIAGQLGKVAIRPECVEAIRFVIMFLNTNSSSTTFNERLLPLFTGSPAEGVYRAMLAHHEKVTERRRAHELRNDPSEIKRHKQQRLAERAQRKSEIDEAWRARTNKKPVE